MRNPLRRLLHPYRRTEYSWPTASNRARAVGRVPMRPWQVRNRRFAFTRRWQRGVDPAEVHHFLDRVADDLATVYADLRRMEEQNIRIKDALRRWQSREAVPPNTGPAHRPIRRPG